MGGINTYVIIGIFVAVIIVFLAKIMVVVQEYAYSENTNYGFSF